MHLPAHSSCGMRYMCSVPSMCRRRPSHQTGSILHHAHVPEKGLTRCSCKAMDKFVCNVSLWCAYALAYIHRLRDSYIRLYTCTYICTGVYIHIHDTYIHNMNTYSHMFILCTGGHCGAAEAAPRAACGARSGGRSCGTAAGSCTGVISPKHEA